MQWLYKKDKKGSKIQKWAIEIEDNKFRSHEGFIDGVISVGDWTICEGKNIGKKNETEPNRQAVLEVLSRYQKKKDKGYTEDIENCERQFEPTLAHVLEEYEKDVIFPVLVSSKLDGVRCLFRKGKIYTRNNKEIVSCPHITKEIIRLGLDNYEWDGELYNHALKANFNKIISLVRKTKPTQADLDESAQIVQFHIFDFVSKSPYPSRYEFIINSLVKDADVVITYKSNCLIPVIHEEAFNYDGVNMLKDMFIASGYEGAMIRWGLHEYKNGRTKYLLKCKNFQDVEATVIDILAGRGKRMNTVGKWVLQLANGITFEASPTGTDEENLKIFLDKSKFIGRIATIKFQDYTPAGVPRFPTFKGIRDYE